MGVNPRIWTAAASDDDGAGVAELLKEIKDTREAILKADTERVKVFDEMKADIAKHGQYSVDTASKLEKLVADMTALSAKHQACETKINDICKQLGRPGGQQHLSDDANRKAAIGLLKLKHDLKFVKADVEHPFEASEEEIAQAGVAVKALSALMHSTDIKYLPDEYRASLSAFNFGSNGFIMSPEMSSRVLSCLTDETDITGLMDSMTISGPSVKFLVDNARVDFRAAWACETSCFANNPQPNLAQGLGELEIKPETLRYIVCATRDLLEDASTNVEAWMIRKVNDAFRRTISDAVLAGDGVGKPLGILNPSSGIQVCETAAATPLGQFTWQDLLLLKMEVPAQYWAGGRYLLNQRTFGLLLTTSTPEGRPLIAAFPQTISPSATGFSLFGSPITIAQQMPDVAPGNIVAGFGNWREAYMVVNRRAVTMQQDPYTAAFCVLFKFDARVGGGIICPNAARWLRIR